MAHRTVENAGVRRNFTFNHNGTEYRVFETDPKRTMDVLRFELWKPGSTKPYVVAFQSEDGERSSCSCPAGLYHRNHGECKHVKMCRSEFLTASTPARRPSAAKPAPKALPATSKSLPARSGQMSLPGLDEVKNLETKIATLRSRYTEKKAALATLQAEMAEIEREGKLCRDRLNTLQARYGENN